MNYEFARIRLNQAMADAVASPSLSFRELADVVKEILDELENRDPNANNGAHQSVKPKMGPNGVAVDPKWGHELFVS